MNEQVLGSGVEELIEPKTLERALKGSKKLRLKLGVDPTSPDLHLGHIVVLGKLRHLQDQGHKAVLIIGDYTAKIGDPSGRNAMRPVLTDKEIAANAKTYIEQAGKMLDIKKTEIRYNSEWLSKLKFDDLLKLAANFTVAQLIERDDFKQRLSEGIEVGLHELLYPVMQAYDSVVVKADVEFGGSDQRFNILAGRSLMKKMGLKPQLVFLTKLLIGTDGKQKMSKSLGNYVGVTDSPSEKYGKIMSIPDELIPMYYELTTDVSEEAVKAAVESIAKGANPRDVKASLARRVVQSYDGDEEADRAASEFESTFSQKLGPTEEMITEIPVAGSVSLLEIVSEQEGSNSAARRLITQGGVKVNDQTADSESQAVSPGDMIKIGKRRFLRLVKK